MAYLEEDDWVDGAVLGVVALSRGRKGLGMCGWGANTSLSKTDLKKGRKVTRAMQAFIFLTRTTWFR